MGVEHDRVVGDRGDLPRLASDLAMPLDRALAAVEQEHLLAGDQGPGARRRIAGADQVVDLVDVVAPVDARLFLMWI